MDKKRKTTTMGPPKKRVSLERSRPLVNPFQLSPSQSAQFLPPGRTPFVAPAPPTLKRNPAGELQLSQLGSPHVTIPRPARGGLLSSNISEFKFKFDSEAAPVDATSEEETVVGKITNPLPQSSSSSSDEEVESTFDPGPEAQTFYDSQAQPSTSGGNNTSSDNVITISDPEATGLKSDKGKLILNSKIVPLPAPSEAIPSQIPGGESSSLELTQLIRNTISIPQAVRAIEVTPTDLPGAGGMEQMAEALPRIVTRPAQTYSIPIPQTVDPFITQAYVGVKVNNPQPMLQPNQLMGATTVFDTESEPFVFEPSKFKKLGGGSWGAVYDMNDGKVIKISNTRDTSNLHHRKVTKMLDEELVGLKFDNPYLVKTTAAFILKNHSGTDFIGVMVMERGIGSLLDFVTNDVFQNNEYELEKRTSLRNFEHDTLRGLEYMHFYGFIHRDIKPENIMLFQGDNRLMCKIGDFGEVTNHTGGNSAGTTMYKPPEAQIMELQSYPGDIWSWAVSFWRLHTNYYLFNWCTLSVDDFRMGFQRMFKVFGGFTNPDLNEQAIRDGVMTPEQARSRTTSDFVQYMDETLLCYGGNRPPQTFLDIMAETIKLNPNERYTASDCLLMPRYLNVFGEDDGLTGMDTRPMQNSAFANRLTLSPGTVIKVETLSATYKSVYKIVPCDINQDKFTQKTTYGRYSAKCALPSKIGPRYLTHLNKREVSNYRSAEVIQLGDDTLTGMGKNLYVYHVQYPSSMSVLHQRLPINPKDHIRAQQQRVAASLGFLKTLSRSGHWFLPIRAISLHVVGEFFHICYATDLGIPSAQVKLTGKSPSTKQFGFQRLHKQLLSAAVECSNKNFPFNPSRLNSQTMWFCPGVGNNSPLLSINLIDMYFTDLMLPLIDLKQKLKEDISGLKTTGKTIYEIVKRIATVTFDKNNIPSNTNVAPVATAIQALQAVVIQDQSTRHQTKVNIDGEYTFQPDPRFTASIVSNV